MSNSREEKFWEAAKKLGPTHLEKAAKNAIDAHRAENPSNETETCTSTVVKNQDEFADYMPIIYTGSGILIGILIALIFFKAALNRMTEPFMK